MTIKSNRPLVKYSKPLYFTFFILITYSCQAQVNYVINGGFEQYSRYAYLTNIEQDITTGDIADAQTLLASPPSGYEAIDETTGVSITDNSDADYIVGNYLKYYGLYIKYLDSTMTGSDSSYVGTLATMCPATNGNVVYQARTLYNIVFDTVTMWNDDSLCSIPTGKLLGIGNTQAAAQRYTLHPNPNHGNMTIVQAQQDNSPVKAEVWNEEGQLMYSNALIFNQKSAHVNIGEVVPGLYLLQLRDSKGKNYTLKFVVH